MALSLIFGHAHCNNILFQTRIATEKGNTTSHENGIQIRLTQIPMKTYNLGGSKHATFSL